MEITITVETRTTPEEAKAAAERIADILRMFVGELGDYPAALEERVDTYLRTDDGDTVWEMGWRVPADQAYPSPTEPPVRVTREARVQTKVKVEL